MRFWPTRGLDAAHDALDRWEASTVALSVQSRALRMGIHCGDPLAFIEVVMSRAALRTKLVLRRLGLTPPEPPTPEMLALLARIEERA